MASPGVIIGRFVGAVAAWFTAAMVFILVRHWGELDWPLVGILVFGAIIGAPTAAILLRCKVEFKEGFVVRHNWNGRLRKIAASQFQSCAERSKGTLDVTFRDGTRTRFYWTEVDLARIRELCAGEQKAAQSGG